MPDDFTTTCFRKAVVRSLAVVAAAASAGCADRTSPLAAALAPDAVDNEVTALAARAEGGDKQAQLELGIRFEEGRGLHINLKQAERWYRRAATTKGGTKMVYIPSSRPGGAAMTVPVDQGPLVTGLPEAELRLRRLRERRDEAASHD